MNRFAELLDRAKAYDAEQLATGHYARIERDGRIHRGGAKRGKLPASQPVSWAVLCRSKEIAR